MLDSNKFIKELFKNDISHLIVVPCSFAKGLINACINNSKLIQYIPCASEAIACSIASGLVLSGKKPLVIIQSSGLTNMGSCLTSLTNPYDIFFPIISSWRTYKDGDSEIQHKHLSINLKELISSYGYLPIKLGSNMDEAIEIINKSFYEKQIILINKNTFNDSKLDNSYLVNLSNFPKRSLFLKYLNKFISSYENYICIGTTGNTSREMYSIMKDSSNFYMVGNMGGALSIGLGAALASKKIIICGGDAEFVMHLGGMTTAGRYSEKIFLIYLVFDNEVNKSTGCQNSYQQHMDYLLLAKSCGWEVTSDIINTLDKFETAIKQVMNKEKGLYFFHVKCDLDEDYPRPSALEIIESKNNFSL